jgi:small subunit ribosomal protein S2
MTKEKAEVTENEEKTGMPIKQELLLEAGVHIGTRIRTNDMRQFVFKRRDDGLFILDLRKTSDRLMNAAKLLSKYKPEDILVVASRIYSSNPATKFCKLLGIPLIRGRFIPGTLTNMAYTGFREPSLLFVCDPKGEREAISEGAKNGVPVIALCDSDNETKFVDYIIPINNKGKRSLALTFYVLSRELMMAQGKIQSYNEFSYDISYFEQMVSAEEADLKTTKEEKQKISKATEEPIAQQQNNKEKKEDKTSEAN